MAPPGQRGGTSRPLAAALWLAAAAAAALILAPWGTAAADASPLALGRRRLLGAAAAPPPSGDGGCSAGSRQLLTNGFWKPGRFDAPENILVAATMANDIYPWAAQYNIPLLDVARGLDRRQAASFTQLFTEKYTAMGATSIELLDYYGENLAVGHAAVLGTPRDVFVVFRGTADVNQVVITGRFYEKTPMKIFNTQLDLYFAPAASMAGIWPKVLPAVRRAIAATRDPAAARVFTAGHSLGGASACLGGLLLEEAGIKVAGVYAFDPYKVGTTCEAGSTACWVGLYDARLGDVTVSVWNNQDPIPQLHDAVFASNPAAAAEWGHVPRGYRGWIRLVGDRCLPMVGRLAEACPPELDAVDGAADGRCAAEMKDHLPWNVLRIIAVCALRGDLPGAGPAAEVAAAARRGSEGLRVDACVRSGVWTALLGLPDPGGR